MPETKRRLKINYTSIKIKKLLITKQEFLRVQVGGVRTESLRCEMAKEEREVHPGKSAM